MSEFPGPLPLQVMMNRQWNDAFNFLYTVTAAEKDSSIDGWLTRTKASDDHAVTRRMINDLIDRLFERKLVDLALAWSFLAADPALPETIHAFLPQVMSIFAAAVENEVYTGESYEIVRETLAVWNDAADGEYVDAKVSVFAIAARETRGTVSNAAFESLRKRAEERFESRESAEAAGPGLVVMPRDKSSKLVAELSHFKDLIGKKLQFVLVKDLYQVQAQLRREYPHAWSAIDLLTRDLRDGKPVRMKPAILLGEPGTGKSRLARRLADLLGTSLYRFDGGSVSDALSWAGTARGWGNTTPSVPARAVQQSMQPNPMILIDEIEKTGTGGRVGSLFSAMTAHLESETAARYRDIALDAELDLSGCSYLATANHDTTIPPHIRDRFRIVRVPMPTLDHLRPLARQVMFDLAVEADVDPRWMASLDADEEDVIAKAWVRSGFSIRKLQKIVSATIEARDATAPRH